MPELLWVIAVLLVIGAVSAVELVPWPYLVELGNEIMLTAAAIGVPLELIYFLSLELCLRYVGTRPVGWYWRSFAHHHLLGPAQRWLVLPFFYTGALSFVAIVLGIAITILGMLAAVFQ